MTHAKVGSRRVVACALSLMMILASMAGIARAQVATTSRISGTVTDSQGAVIPGAEVVVTSQDTGAEFKARTSDEGTFLILSLSVGVYTVAVTAKGFKQTVVTNVKTEVGGVATVAIKLEVGATSETVTVTSGAEVLQKESTVIGSTITGRQITQLPFTSRDALDLVLNLPGTQSGGRPRASTINGLPKSTLNITLDGVNVQDANLRSTDGFFTYVRPRIDAIEEVRVTTAGQTAEAGAGGAVQIAFVTKGGTNEYHGGAWWYHRQRVLNANYYFNNLRKTPRAQVMLNQWGLKLGGPITPWLKDRAFFFFSYDEFRLPEQAVRSRTILSADAQRGIFKFPDAAAPGGFRTIDVLSTAGGAGFTSTFDPLLSKVLADIRSSTSVGSITQTSDPNFETFTFINTGGQVRRFPDFRFDINMSSKHHLETTYHYQDFAGQADFLNNVDPAFPSPVPQIFGSQGSDRFAFATALRSQLTSKVVNEARLGLAGGTVLFFGNLAPGDFAPFGGIILDFPLVSDPQTANNNSRRNGPRWEFKDSLSWVKGKHNVSVGGTLIKNSLFSQSSGGVLVPQVRFGVAQTDPVFNAFNAVPTNFRGNARGLYALLTGRVDQVSINGKLDEKTKQYTLDGTAITRNEQWEYGFYGQDSFKFRDNLTINYGLRWEAVLTPRHLNGVYIRPGFENLFGVSGVGNLFKPGVIAGAAPTYSPVTKDTKAYDDDMNNFAPNIGIAWSPRFENSLLKRIFGDGEQTVFRTGYSISFFTGGNFDFDGVWSGNPGLTSFAGKRAEIEFAPGTVLLRNGLPALTAPPNPTFPRPASIGIQMRDFDPHQTTPYVQSWSFGIQRELGRETVIEARYVGNRSVGLYGTINLNEVNIFENGFLQEFVNAQRNLAISRANARGDNFRNAGLAGQVPLPIFEASFGSATSNNFANSGFITNLDRGVAGSAANTLATTLAFQNNRVARGLAPNLFQVNPSNLANSVISTNTGGSTYYNALQVELRRRLSRGLLVQGNYTFARSLETFGTTIRAMNSDKGASPYDIRHAFKVNYVYELPFGAGRGWNYRGPGGIIGKVIEGWETDGIVRWQSGRQFSLTSGRLTVNGTDSGLILVGMTWEELQREVKIRKAPDDSTRGTVFWLPKDIVENTQKAFGTIAGTPTGRYFAPPTTPGKLGFYYDLYGPNFFRADLSLVKKTRITERTNIEFRTEFLNAFNNPNFLVGAASNDATGVTVGGLSFGQTDQAYLDTSTTNDPGGRLIQFVLRVNF
jgi:hypothetical protein